MTFNDAERVDVVKRARAMVGKPYQFAAAGPTAFDCSGLTLYAWKPYTLLPHESGKQPWASGVYAADARIRLPRATGGVLVYMEYFLRPGDLVFYYEALNQSPTHVALYSGRRTNDLMHMVIQATGQKSDGTVEGVVEIPLTEYARPTGYGFMSY